MTHKHQLVEGLPFELLLVGRPQLKPIVAVFDPDKRQTVYTEKATGPDERPLSYEWTLVEHNDATCVLFEPNVPADDSATWHHGDDQGCDHSLEGSNGHVGTITVIVRNAAWACVAFYNGSNSGQGPDPDPSTCVEL